jgi:ATP-dependent RNA helicase DHX36
MELREDDEKQRMEFPPDLTNTERKFVHELCIQLGLKSKSTGKGEARHIVVTKINPTAKKTDDETVPVLSVGRKGIEALKQHMRKFPPTHTEELESYETGASLVEVLAQGHDDTALSDRLNQLGLGVKQQAPKANRREKHVDLARRKSVHAKAQLVKQNNATYNKMLQMRSQLPAYQHQEEIVRTVKNNPVTIVSGETGCGKSTQVPQFLLDANPTWSLVVTQPRRISAISIAERVVEEQCQAAAGGLIGYQVRLESAVTADTQLVFLTPGVLLRKMQSSPLLKEYTCVIIDEIHERDKYQEFLLIVLRDLLPLRPDLRIVLMSATLQTTALVDFFGVQGVQPAVVEMEGRMFPVQEFFLEKVLEMTGYIDATTGYDGGATFEAELAKLIGKEQQPPPQQQEQQQQQQQTDVSIQCVMCGKRGFSDAVEFGAHIALCTGIAEEDDNASADIADDSTVEASPDFSEFADYELEDYDVDGKIELEDYDVHGLSDMKASPPADTPDTVGMDGGSAGEGGDENTNSEVVKWDGESPFELATATAEGDGPTQTEEELLNQYQVMHDDETVDNFLLLEIVQYIVKSSYGDGGILIFFSGWNEISEFSLLLETTAPFRDRSKFLILPLHSGIPSKDQRRVLQRPPRGVRKIVLSTNSKSQWSRLCKTECASHLHIRRRSNQPPYFLFFVTQSLKHR